MICTRRAARRWDSPSRAWACWKSAPGTRGLAALIDGGGNDQYLSRPAFVDDLRYRDHFLSLSQGFSTGFSPRHPGGIGALWDRGGEDLYAADIFAQGSGYW